MIDQFTIRPSHVRLYPYWVITAEVYKVDNLWYFQVVSIDGDVARLGQYLSEDVAHHAMLTWMHYSDTSR